MLVSDDNRTAQSVTTFIMTAVVLILAVEMGDEARLNVLKSFN